MSKFSSWKTILLLFAFCAAVAISSPAQTFKTLASFDGTNGGYPYFMSLVQGTDGNFYGTTWVGGANNDGTVFKITPAGALTTLHSFEVTDGAAPYAGLVLATSGNFYGITTRGGAKGYGTVFEITPAGKLTTLHSFEGGSADGAWPEGGLVQATNGNFYGTTYEGGADNDGTVFEITAAGKLTTLYSFDGNCGEDPVAGLVQATNGNFYGTTVYDACVFEITAAGKLTTLLSFDGTDGDYPTAGLVQASNGNFYGTAPEGGAHGDGTVFEITAAGKLTTLLSFDESDGGRPEGWLVQGTNGNFYGTTNAGGADDDGTVFEITPAGKPTTLASFDESDGANPVGGLVQATNGNFYGTTYYGGAHGLGTVFSLAVGLGPFVETNPTSGAVGTAVIILGNNLTGTTSVTFNGTAASFKVVSSTEITATVPKGATTGVVKVKTPKGTLASNVSFRVP
jgi:uncharacterized repeat protein (TIGR03803 family)